MSVSVMNGSIRGEVVGVRFKRATTFIPRRTCAKEGCATFLSVYNPTPECAIHGA